MEVGGGEAGGVIKPTGQGPPPAIVSQVKKETIPPTTAPHLPQAAEAAFVSAKRVESDRTAEEVRRKVILDMAIGFLHQMHPDIQNQEILSDRLLAGLHLDTPLAQMDTLKPIVPNTWSEEVWRSLEETTKKAVEIARFYIDNPAKDIPTRVIVPTSLDAPDAGRTLEESTEKVLVYLDARLSKKGNYFTKAIHFSPVKRFLKSRFGLRKVPQKAPDVFVAHAPYVPSITGAENVLIGGEAKARDIHTLTIAGSGDCVVMPFAGVGLAGKGVRLQFPHGTITQEGGRIALAEGTCHNFIKHGGSITPATYDTTITYTGTLSGVGVCSAPPWTRSVIILYDRLYYTCLVILQWGEKREGNVYRGRTE